MKCNQCPRKCDTERTEKGFGFCGVGELPKIARAALHFDEEPPISGTRGAGTIFFSGCNLRCVFCQNYDISEEHQGVVITPYELSEEYRKLEAMGAQNIEFVTPSHYVNAILESLTYYRPRLPLIWNSSGYDSIETLKRLEGVIDIYLPDFKYSDNELAKRLSHCGDYVETATAAIDEMLRQQPEIIIENGVIKKGVIIRHLVLPSHTKNSIGVLESIKERYGTSALVSLMAQYMPAGKAADYPDINRKLTKREYNKVLNKYIELDLDGFAQELDASDQKYVPEWNYGN
ncbi:radical SAM protein [uncultured Ruminococcus sp.]|uniref:radical SAM protein n=1 Tax=uncultured Ruminococcus sp. TaxID=165186 RepID=UPI00292D68EE|nr:radical SAM protein [uncultured Ruminococcus sp.]